MGREHVRGPSVKRALQSIAQRLVEEEHGALIAETMAIRWIAQEDSVLGRLLDVRELLNG